MLLLILFSGFVASCAAQTTSASSQFSSSATEVTTMTTAPFSGTIQPTAVLPAPDSVNNAVAILQTAVQSTLVLNETTLDPVLNKLHELIQQLQPDLSFSLTVKNFTEV